MALCKLKGFLGRVSILGIFIALTFLSSTSYAFLSPSFFCSNSAYPGTDLQLSFNISSSVAGDYYLITNYESRYVPLLTTSTFKSLMIKSDSLGAVFFNVSYPVSPRTFTVTNFVCAPSSASFWGINSSLSFIAGLVVVSLITRLTLLIFGV